MNVNNSCNQCGNDKKQTNWIRIITSHEREMSEHEIELDHEHEQKLFLQQIWKLKNWKLNNNGHKNVKTHKFRLDIVLNRFGLHKWRLTWTWTWPWNILATIVEMSKNEMNKNMNMNENNSCNQCGNDIKPK